MSNNTIILTANNTIIHSLWIGKTLSRVELLCIESFLAHKHSFHLWVYETPETPLPEGTILEDANKIIPDKNVFSYRKTNQFGHGKGSYAGFSDIFRYKLLYEHGGWWVDMDVICLKPFDFKDDYVFREHHDFPVVGNMMKCPKESELMKRCFEQAVIEVDQNNVNWNKPVQILNDNIQALNLTSYIRAISNHDKWFYIRKFLYKNMKIPTHWYALHLINEEWRRNIMDKNVFFKNSSIGNLYEKYMGYDKEVIVTPSSFNKFKLSLAGAFIIQFWTRITAYFSG